ncbi:histidine phosphatase superfamily protein, clade-1 [Kipferlia bialata]|uniref:Histidine phosphatase superfamily protein, clade-1 n=1 Tax=Kipferlia bialata TaxID=797122 RepID=A0A9K3D6J5_9EUKA|nr:histidine phosphatase superfamily protein, clade-1 [Kipferlia bialata]|eukprot:g12383.t1
MAPTFGTVHPKTVYLVRHGETPFNTDPIPKFRGRIPIPLSDLGLRHVDQTGQYLQTRAKMDSILYSPVRRATQTAEAVYRYQPNSTFTMEPLLDDISWGDWESQPIPHGQGGPFETQEEEDMFKSDPTQFIIPNGETFQTVLDRVHRLWHRLVHEDTR